MKKLILFIFAIGIAAASYGYELNRIESNNNSVLNYIIEANAASTDTIAIDLSDTTNYPHDYTGTIHISAISIDLFRATDSSGTIKLGVVTRSGDSNGDITNFMSIPFSTSGETTILLGDVFSPSMIKTDVNSSAATPYIASTDINTSTASIVNSATIPTSLGSTAIPAVGDIILSILRTNANVITFSIRLFYHSER